MPCPSGYAVNLANGSRWHSLFIAAGFLRNGVGASAREGSLLQPVRKHRTLVSNRCLLSCSELQEWWRLPFDPPNLKGRGFDAEQSSCLLVREQVFQIDQVGH